MRRPTAEPRSDRREGDSVERRPGALNLAARILAYFFGVRFLESSFCFSLVTSAVGLFAASLGPSRDGAPNAPPLLQNCAGGSLQPAATSPPHFPTLRVEGKV